MPLARRVTLTISRGDILQQSAGALVTSANDALSGNGQPMYWRFISRQNVDGTMRKLAGDALTQRCLDIEPVAPINFRRDLTRWTSGVKHGDSALVRCRAGSAVSTPASGALLCDHVVHAVAPDSEFGYEGIYTGGRHDQAVSGAVRGPDTPQDFTPQQFTPPDDLLLSAYVEALEEAVGRLQATSVVCPALGAGVKGWKPSISACLGLEAVARLLQPAPGCVPAQPSDTAASAAASAAAASSATPLALRFVIGGYGPLADSSWKDWVRVAPLLLGAPSGLEDAAEYTDAAKRGSTLTWELSVAELAAAAAARPALSGSEHATAYTLPLANVPEVREMWENRARGYSGKDEPLTPEQELAAAKRRTTR